MLRLRSFFIVMTLGLASVAYADGLLGTYYNQDGQQRQYFSGDTVVRVDPVIDFNWGTAAPDPAIGADDFSVRWTGELLTPNNNGNYRFRTNSDDGVRLYLDRNRDGDFNDNGELLIDNWTDHGATQDTSGNVNLSRNTYYPIMLEYYERGGDATIQLYWDIPGGGTSYVIIPTANLNSLQPPEIVSVINGVSATDPCGDPRTLVISWNIPVVTGTEGGNNPANFSIPGGPNVTGAALSGDGLTTTLTLDSDLINGATYQLQVNNVRSTVRGLLASATQAFTASVGTRTSGGLAASYYPAPGFGGTPIRRVDAGVDFDWAGGNPGIPGFPADLFSVRWEGFITVPADYNGEFWVRSDDGVRLWVNNQLLIDNWTDHSATVDRGAIALTAGQTYPIRLEFYENGGDAVIQLGYEACTSTFFIFCLGTADSVVPAGALSYCDSGQMLGGFLVSVASGTASTCVPLAVTIAAHDTSGNPMPAYTGQVAIESLPAGATHGDWSLAGGNGTLINGPANDGAANYTFVNLDNGAASFELSNAHADDVVIRVTDVLSGTASASGTIQFRDNAFVITADDDILVAGRTEPFNVRMVRREVPGDPSSDCGIATGYAGNRALKAWISRDAVDPGGAAPAIASLSLPESAPASPNLSLAFTAGEAAFALDTADVGKYGLQLLDDSGDFANAIAIGGMSNMLTVRPFALSVRNVRAGGTVNPQGSGALDAAFVAAGSEFTADVAAVLWDVADDADDDGMPDEGANLDDNALAVSFRNEVLLSAELLEPAAGVLGSFPNQDVSAAAFAGGVAAVPNPLRYDEVGSIRINAASDNYLGMSDASITGFSAPVGRFHPAYLTTAIVTHGCGANFTYAGQPIGELVIRAHNALGDVTLNYFGNGNAATSFSRDIMLTDAAGELAGAFVNGGVSFADFSAGSVTLTDVAFALSSKESGPGRLAVRAAEIGGEASSMGHAEAETTIRSGRVAIRNRTVNSLTQAEQPVIVEAWQDLGGSFGWDINTLDDCTSLSASSFSLANFTGNLAGHTAVIGYSYTNGSGIVTLAAPGAGNEGSVDVSAAVPAWLKYDWQGAGPEDPVGTVFFQGLYRDEAGFIDRREVVY